MTTIREAFVMPSGWTLLEADYSQMEVVCLAALSRDPTLIQEVVDGVDMHTRNAAMWRRCEEGEVSDKDRRTAKIMTFQLFYGAMAKRIARDFGLPLKETEGFISTLLEKYPGVAEWWENTYGSVMGNIRKEYLYMKQDPTILSTLEYPYGKRYTFQGEVRKGRWGPPKENIGPQFVKNYPVQGLASDILKFAQAAIWRNRVSLLDMGAVPVLQVHDNLCFKFNMDLDIEDFLSVLREYMIKAPIEKINTLAGYRWWPEDLPLRIDVKTGNVWATMEKKGLTTE